MSGTEKRAPGGAPKGAKPKRDGESAVSMPKHASRPQAQGINFGTVDDQSAVMSSSPAAQPAAGQHLQGGAPTAFGSVSAESGAAHEKKIGFGKKQLDFQKLFQGGSTPKGAPAKAAAPNTAAPAAPNAASKPARPAPPARPVPAPAAPFGAPWQPPMYAPMGYSMSPNASAYAYLQPQQPWQPGSPHLGNLPTSPPRPMQPPRPGGAPFYPGAPASPSPSFTMNAGARMFEPQKSRALRIVNPETHTELDLDQVRAKTSAAEASKDPSPTVAPSKPAPTDAAAENRIKTQTDFQQKVLRLKAEKEAEARRAEEAKAAAEKEAAEKAAAEKEAAEKAAAEKEAAEKAAAEKEAAEKAAAEKEAAEKAAAEREAAEKEAAEKAAAEQAAAEKAAADRAAAEKEAADKAAAEKEAADKAAAVPEAESGEAEGQVDGEGGSSDVPEASTSGPRAIDTARPIEDLGAVQYPPSVQPPDASLNQGAAPGKFRYDRDFLLQFMSVYTEKPADLPVLASIGLESVSGGRGGRRGMAPGRGGMGGRGRAGEDRFAGGRGGFGGSRTHSLSRGGSGGPLPSRETMGTGIPTGGRGKSSRGRQREGGGRRENPPEKGGPTIPLDQVVPLAYSENRWKPQSREKDKAGDHADVVERKVKALLNKLTVERFESISDQIVEYANQSVNETDGRTLRQVIALVFEKAIDESAWSEMYAQLCAKIQTNLSPDVRDEVLEAKEQKEYRGGYLFRKYLLTWCQGDFEKGWGSANHKSEKEYEQFSDEYYAAQKAKRRGLGLVQFVGELFKLQMLQPRIMHTCIVRLLRTTTEPEEDEIESVCRLLTTVGYLLDTTSGNHKSRMDVYFKRIDDILQSPALSSRMRFMLLDVVDLRADNWVPRHDTSAPKTIAEIHAEAAKEQQAKETEKFSRGGLRRGGAPLARDAPARASSDGWSTVGNAPPARGRAGDLSGFGKGIERAGAGGKLGGGPQSIFSRRNQREGKGDDDASPSRKSLNMFNLLGEGGGDEAPRRKLQLQPRTKPVEEPAPAPAAPSAEDIARKVGNDVKEFLAIRDIGEGVASIEALGEEHRAKFVDALAAAVLDKKQDSVDAASDLLAALAERHIVSEAQLVDGFRPQVTILDDTSMDAPSAYSFMAQLLVRSGLARAQIEALADGMEGEGLKPPRDRLLAKVDDIA